MNIFSVLGCHMLSYYLWVLADTKEAHFGLSPPPLPQSSLLLAQQAPGQKNISVWSKNGVSTERMWIITGRPLCPRFPLAILGPSEQLVQHQSRKQTFHKSSATWTCGTSTGRSWEAEYSETKPDWKGTRTNSLKENQKTTLEVLPFSPSPPKQRGEQNVKIL